jgi:hypothetical protein
LSKRRNFTRAVRVEIVKRSTKPHNGGLAVFCENCRLPVLGRFEIDHRDPDAMQIDKSKPLTAADGWLLCLPCHKEKTKKDRRDIGKAKRREAEHLGVKRDKPPIPQRPKGEKPPAKASARGRSGIARRFVSIGEAASAVLAKLNPKKAAE